MFKGKIILKLNTTFDLKKKLKKLKSQNIVNLQTFLPVPVILYKRSFSQSKVFLARVQTGCSSEAFPGIEILAKGNAVSENDCSLSAIYRDTESWEILKNS